MWVGGESVSDVVAFHCCCCLGNVNYLKQFAVCSTMLRSIAAVVVVACSEGVEYRFPVVH